MRGRLNHVGLSHLYRFTATDNSILPHASFSTCGFMADPKLCRAHAGLSFHHSWGMSFCASVLDPVAASNLLPGAVATAERSLGET